METTGTMCVDKGNRRMWQGYHGCCHESFVSYIIERRHKVAALRESLGLDLVVTVYVV